VCSDAIRFVIGLAASTQPGFIGYLKPVARSVNQYEIALYVVRTVIAGRDRGFCHLRLLDRALPVRSSDLGEINR